MKPRHAAALALVVWYLMVAPPQYDRAGRPVRDSLGNQMADLAAPLSNYEIVGTFDSALGCQAEENRFRMSHGSAWTLYQRHTAQCFAEDDPRLAK